MTQNISNNSTGSICAEEYTVKRGDSFYLIAHKLGVPLRDLLAANRNIHPARLMVGDVLCIPREEDDSVAGGGTGGSGNTGTGGNGSTGGGSGSTGGTGGSGSGSTGSGGSTGGGSTGGTGGSGSTGGGGSSGGTGGSGSTGGGGSTGGTGSGGSTGSTGSGGSTGGGTTGGTGGSGSTGSGGTGSGGSTGNGGTTGTPGSGTTTTEPTPSCPVEEQFIIQRGQTVADIQLRSLLSRHTLETANPNVNLDALRVGQTICVPTENIPCTIPDTYTLETSETLEAVAVRFNLPVASILRANPCLAPQDFEAGVTVALPR